LIKYIGKKHILKPNLAGVGQTQDVTIIRLISKNSIEEYILKLADIKLRLDKSISEADGEVDTETEKKNLRELLQNEFNNVE
jgi:SWI/SNF-related matrix-associated actin-dependent regulator 1 of chromatin subfamily A